MPFFKKPLTEKIAAGEKMGVSFSVGERDRFFQLKGHVYFHMWDGDTHQTQIKWDKQNVITLDAGLLMAALMKDPNEPKHGLNMLAVGTGALGNLLNPDAPGQYQRQLNNEIGRKTFAETIFVDSKGAKSSVRTPVVDFTTIFGQGEATGPWNEMGLLSTISDNPGSPMPNPNQAQSPAEYDPTIDTSNYDMLFNYLTFGVITKPATSILSVKWRITFGG